MTKIEQKTYEPVIIVEDEEIQAQLLQRKLERMGMRTLVVMNGTEAEKVIESHAESLILLDFELQDMTGGEVIQNLNAKQIFPRFIMITAYGDERLAVTMMKQGALDYIVKDENFLEAAARAVLKAFQVIQTQETLQKAREELRKLSRAVEQSSAGIFITNPKGIIEYVNPGFTSITGYSAEEALGKTPRFLKSGVHPPEFYNELWSVISSGREWRGEFCNRRKNGEFFWEAAVISPVKNENGEITNFVAIKDDISVRKKAEEDLLLAKRELESRVLERTSELSRANTALREEIEKRLAAEQDLIAALREADAANRAKSEFLAGVSHDLRTPLNTILGYAQMLKKGESDPEITSRAISVMQRGGEHLLRMINDLLDMAKLESGLPGHAPERLELRAFLQALAEASQPAAIENHIRFETKFRGLLPAVMADESKLRRVLDNLIGNAMKFARYGRVILEASGKSAHPAGKETVRVLFRVKDSGRGIPAERTSEIFRPFARLNKDGSGKGGTGLGLAIADRLTRVMGGKIKTRTRPGLGSVFSFVLEFPVCSDSSDSEREKEQEREAENFRDGREDEASSPGSDELVRDIPLDLLERIVTYARMGNPRRILDGLRPYLDRENPFAMELEKLARDFQFQELNRKIKDAREEGAIGKS